MEDKEKLKEQLLLKLKDIEFSQVALLEKIAIVQLNLEEIPNKEITDMVVKIFSDESNNHELIKQVIEKYEEYLKK